MTENHRKSGRFFCEINKEKQENYGKNKSKKKTVKRVF